jgi:ribosomal protein L12E/L44/L45/RPP1/RPP2
METVVVQINNNKAYKLLADLEDLQILKVLKKKKQHTISLSEKYAGKLTSKTADALQDYVKQSREEWNHTAI